MKLKKKHFKKLKEIAVSVNQIVPGTGIRLDKLIAEIESVQKDPVEDLIYAMHRKDVENNIQKESDAMVAASTDDSTTTEGLRKYLVDSTGWRPLEFGGSDFAKTIDTDPDPKIGDVGYFWDEPCISAVFGKLVSISGTIAVPVKYKVVLNGEFVRYYKNFSKTPPELK